MMQTRFPFNWLLNTNSVLAQWFCHADVDDSVQAQRDGRSADGT